MLEALFLAANLTVYICPPLVIVGTEPYCVQVPLNNQQTFFGNQMLCIKAIRFGDKYGAWRNLAEIRGVITGTIIRLECSPYRLEFVME